MSNFQFLQEEWSSLYRKVILAEQRVFTEPVSSASYCRIVLEECMHLIYDLEHIDLPYNTELVNLLNEEQIKVYFHIRLEKD